MCVCVSENMLAFILASLLCPTHSLPEEKFSLCNVHSNTLGSAQFLLAKLLEMDWHNGSVVVTGEKERGEGRGGGNGGN